MNVESRPIIVLCLVVLITISGYIVLNSWNPNNPTSTQSDSSEYNLGKLSPEINKSIESLDESESIVLSITVDEELSKREFNLTVSKIKNQTVTFRSTFMNDRLITARAKTEQVRNLTKIDRIVMIDLAETASPSS